MVVCLDLNASPVPEEDEDAFEGQVEKHNAPEERVETAVDIERRVPFPLLFLFFHLIMSWLSKLGFVHGAFEYCDGSFLCHIGFSSCFWLWLSFRLVGSLIEFSYTDQIC